MAHQLVFAEVNDGVLHDGSLACLGAARALAGPDDRVGALLAGAGVADHAAALFAAGADRVLVCEHEALAAYVAAPFCRAVTAAVRAVDAGVILLPASTVGNDLASVSAAALDAACVLDADAVSAGPEGLRASRAGFDRKVMTHFAPAADGPAVLTLRDGAFTAPEPDAARTGTPEPLEVDLSATSGARVQRRDVATKTVNLKDAKVIVAVGAGVGNAEGLGLVRALADALGAELGATRAVVDAGWLPADHQIGQTGATVRPDLYIACGISGAVQHRVGMMDAGTIIAINTDANAPIFRVAHYKLVGDLRTVVPRLTQLLQA
jgi:electron transfer flavoprotein alpha subunit